MKSCRNLVVKSAKIVVSDRHPNDYRVELLVIGILPGCRKPVTLAESPATKQIIFRPLKSSNAGVARIRPADYERMVDAAPVVSSGVFPVAQESLAEITDWARSKIRSLTASAAVCVSDGNGKSDHEPRYDCLVLPENMAEAA